jgi:hypothetical protein
MSIRDGATVPIGIPTHFLRDQLAQAVDPQEILTAEPGGLLDEYTDAWGYGFPWGHLIEQKSTWREPRPGGYVCWRVVPEALWRGSDRLRKSTACMIAHTLADLRIDALRFLAGPLPDLLTIVGVHPKTCRYPHTLLTLLLCDLRAERQIREWLEETFLRSLLPELLARLEQRLRRARSCGRSNEPVGVQSMQSLPRHH